MRSLVWRWSLAILIGSAWAISTPGRGERAQAQSAAPVVPGR
jgi:hypothetical protein